VSESESGKRSFPDWLIDRDETLSGARTNPLFQSFEIRRAHGSGLSDILRDPAGAAVGLIPLGGIALVVLLTVMMPPGFCCWFIIVAPLTWAAMNMMRGRRSDAAFVPTELSRVIGRSVYRPVLQDLWLTPSGGRVFAEAMVLESRAGSHIGAALCVSFPIVICVGAYVAFAIMDHETLTPGDIALMAGFTVFTVSLVKPIYWLFALGAVSDTLSQFRFASTKTPLRLAGKTAASSIAESIAHLAAIGAVVASLVGLGILFFSFVVMPILGYAEGMEREGSLGRLIHGAMAGNLPQVAMAGLFLIAVPIVAATSRMLRRRYQTRFAALADEADALLRPIVESTFEEN